MGKTLFLPVVHHTNLKTTPESLEDTLTANNLQLPTHLSTTMSFTANSRAPQIHPSNAPQEPTGQVASDSLAAESLKNQGGFAENAHAAASSVSGSSSTLNNTDTSGAKVLQPAEDGTAREKQNALGLGPDEKGVTGVKLDAAGKPAFDGVHNKDGYYGGSAAQTSGGSNARPAGASDFGASTVGGGSATSADPNIKSGSTATGGNSTGSGSGGPTAGAGVRPHVDAAPGYTSTVTGAAAPPGTYKPKGANLEDADATESMPKPKVFIGDVGGSHDPGRLAEQNFEARNTGPAQQVSSSGNEGGAQRQAGSGGREAVGEQGGSFGVLDSERA